MEEINTALLDWNPWIGGEMPAELYGYKREVNLADSLKFKEIKIIEGGRRVGKSTLLYQVISEILKTSNNVLYINFDDEIINKFTLREIFNSFLEIQNIDYLFLDEIQNCKQWVSFIRKLYDTRTVKQIYITGSNSTLIKQEYATLLTGRTTHLDIKPLNFKEYLSFKNINYKLRSSKNVAVIKNEFYKYMKEGGFPEVVKREYSKKELLVQYFEDFIYKDIVSRYKVNASKVKELAIFLASNIGKPISYRKTGISLNLSNLTVQDYINYLKEIYILSEIYKYDFSLKKQYHGKKKPYFLDVGIANNISFRFSSDTGRVLENIVYNNLKDAYLYDGSYECDFLVKEDLKITQAIQVTNSIKSTENREIKGVVEAMDSHNLKDGLILTLEDEDMIEIDGKKIIVLPVWKWLLQ